MIFGAIGGIKIGRGNRSTRRKPAPSNFPEDVHMCDLLVNFLDIHWNDVNISIETVETLEEIENNSDGSGSCDSNDM
jgi:hypothetical protein